MTLYDTDYNRQLQQRIMDINRRAIEHGRHFYTSIDTQMGHMLGSGYDENMEAFEGAGKEERPEVGYGVEALDKNFQGNYADTALSTWDKDFIHPAMTRQEAIQYTSGGGLVQQDEIKAQMNAQGIEPLLTTKEGGAQGAGFLDDFWTGFKMPFEAVGSVAKAVAPALPFLGIGKPKGKRGRPKKGGNMWDDIRSAQQPPPISAPIPQLGLGRSGGKKRGRPKKGGSMADVALELIRRKQGGANIGLAQSPESVAYFADKEKQLEGGNFWDTLGDIAKVAVPIITALGKPKKGRKKKCKKTGGADCDCPLEGGAVLPEASSSFGALIDGEGRKKKKGGRMLKDNVQLQGHYGGAKRSNPRAEIVRQVMKEKGLSLAQASKYVKEHNLYKK